MKWVKEIDLRIPSSYPSGVLSMIENRPPWEEIFGKAKHGHLPDVRNGIEASLLEGRELVEQGDFLEIFCAADLEVCESRDPKGLYAKARSGVIKEFTGISSPYEAPENPELSIDTGSQDLAESVQVVIKALEAQGVIPTA